MRSRSAIPNPKSQTVRPDLRGCSLSGLETLVVAAGEPRYRGRQLFKWIHNRGASSFEEMTDLPKAFRVRAAEVFGIESLVVAETRLSSDGTIKYRMDTGRGDFVESVYMPSARRDTLCVSTQVGCAMGCAFCLTGAMRLGRDLSAGEIVDQVRTVAVDLRARLHHGGEGPRPPHRRYVSNVVFMGMGEPLKNFEATRDAVAVLTHPDALGFSTRHVTVSTCGLVPEILRFGREVTAKLAVSLNAADDETRSRLMPINKKYPLADLLSALKRFPLKPGWRITFEYVLLAGVNDSVTDARRLVKILSGIPSKVNLIVFNAHPAADFKAPTPEAVAAFHKVLTDKNLSAFVRENRGGDVAAACGQLGRVRDEG
ncbi:MAG: 23S rRNA (adenine(2503)-C(2))-methyltransferase RlmN [Deltaproteobacteria bacterium]|nr:23S rRNA (adenine(2503)-C(2))-methyltransferase RlmN [Deltaproteobacteria bacterium]